MTVFSHDIEIGDAINTSVIIYVYLPIYFSYIYNYLRISFIFIKEGHTKFVLETSKQDFFLPIQIYRPCEFHPQSSLSIDKSQI